MPLNDWVSRANDKFSADCPSSKQHGGAPFDVVRALAQELDAWRDALPTKLQWSDADKFGFTEADSLSQTAHSSYFNLSKGAGPGEMDHNVDISVAHLRTCYYQGRFLVHRPFIYKALHQPELLTASDRRFCAFAIESSCHWPTSLAPPKNKKHLLPHLFAWTQNFLAITLILDFCCEQGPLSSICRESGTSEEYIRETVKAMRTWLEDTGQIDGIANWGIKVFT